MKEKGISLISIVLLIFLLIIVTAVVVIFVLNPSKNNDTNLKTDEIASNESSNKTNDDSQKFILSIGGYKVVLGADGQPIMGYYKNVNDGNNNFTSVFVEDPNGYSKKRVLMENVGDGISVETLDLSAWQNRVTDYGKRFSVVNNNGSLMIHVYN